MKKIAIILLITILAAFGCTRIPASVETGVMPGEYEGSNTLNAVELKTENEKLKSELEETSREFEKFKNDYFNTAKNNDLTIKKLNEAESLLKQLQDNGLVLPEFNLEQTDKNNIAQYINERKSLLDNNFKSIEIIPLEEIENIIIFYTVGYGENYHQMFIWEIGKNEPFIVEGASFNKDGNWKWLLQDKYIIIDSAKTPVNEKIIVGIDEMKVVSTFEVNSDNIYLIPNTASILMQKPKTDNIKPLFIVYDFINGEEKELDLEFQDKNLELYIDDENKTIQFIGTYTNEDGIEYSVQATMSINKLKEKYSIKALEESEEQKNLTGTKEDSDVNEEGTV